MSSLIKAKFFIFGEPNKCVSVSPQSPLLEIGEYVIFEKNTYHIIQRRFQPSARQENFQDTELPSMQYLIKLIPKGHDPWEHKE